MAYFSIRNKFFAAFSLLAFVALTSSFFVVYTAAKNNLQETIKNELENSTELITNLVETVARSSIENHLRSIAETQRVMVSGYYEDYELGIYTEQEAKALAARFLKRQHIGTTGYTYCLNSMGIVTVHPDMEVDGSDVSSYGFVQEQMRLKTGYIEYEWKNPGEPQTREKALYMSYFPEWDWIISVSAYKSEFSHLIDINNISKALLKVNFGGSGYPFIFDADGNIIFHPSLRGNIFKVGLKQEFIFAVREIFRQQRGTLFYKWKNPDENIPRDKIVIFRSVEDYNWIVGSSAYLDDLYKPLDKIRQTFLVIFCLYLLLNLLASYGLSTLITRPLKVLMAHFRSQSPTAVKEIRGHFGNDEIGRMADYLNQFILQLKEHHLALSTEIKERQQSEQALRKSEQTFHALFDNSFQFIALLDTSGRVRNINKTALNFRNLQLEDVVDEYFWDTPWWNHSESLVEQLKEAYTRAIKGEVARFEAYSNNVREIFLDISIKPVLDDTGQVIYLIAEARDVTEIRRAEKELQQAQKMESVGTLAGGIAHDFNNALAGILGTLTLLQLKRDKGKSFDEETIFRHLEMISKAALRAKDVVNQLLTLSRKYDFEFAPLDLRNILEQVCLIAGNSFDKSIRIEAHIDRDIPVTADANSMEQVFLNLCINASHAMTIMRPSGESYGGVLKITVERVFLSGKPEMADGEYWCISITDDGVGIADADLEKVFVPFFTTKPKGTGSGLGLAMVYNIVQQHKGFVEVLSQQGFGTSVRVFLPVGENISSKAEDLSNEALIEGTGTILVIDDEELVRANAAEFLSTCGYEVLMAENGAEGLAVYKENIHQIDLVLLDLVMPVMSGKETFFALKSCNSDVRVLLSSGFRHDSRVDDILAGGAAGFIQKPYSLFSLSRGVESALSTADRYNKVIRE